MFKTKKRNSKDKSPEKAPAQDGGGGWAGSFANPKSYSVMDDHLDSTTEMAAWFCSGMAREEVKLRAAAILEKGLPGEFMVRDKQGAPHCYALTVKDHKDGFATFLIEKSPDAKKPGYMVRGCGAICQTIAKLIKYYRDELRPELGVQLKNAGPYIKDYVATIYRTEQEKEARRKESNAKQKYSKGSLEAKQKSFADELDDDEEEEEEEKEAEDGNEGAVYDMASSEKKPEEDKNVYDMASSGNSNKEGDGAVYDMASTNTNTKADDGAMYDMASPNKNDGAVDYDMAAPNKDGDVYPKANGSESFDGSDQPDETGMYDNVSPNGLVGHGNADDIYSAPQQKEDNEFDNDDYGDRKSVV